jgi:hypothetical protein
MMISWWGSYGVTELAHQIIDYRDFNASVGHSRGMVGVIRPE